MLFFKHLFHNKKKTKVYALVGRSGTGKSFRAPQIAAKYRINYIIDDGLLIKGNKIIAGKSAKQESNFLAAVKCAVFTNPEHRNQILQTLDSEKFKKILIIGTSEKMALRIAEILNLPQPEKIIHIEDIATKDEIDTAMHIRFSEGKHIIPVSTIQVTRFYPGIVYDSIKSTISGTFFGRKKKTKNERTLVRPEFSKPHEAGISEAVLRQMVNQCIYAFGRDLKVEDFSSSEVFQNYVINISLRAPVKLQQNEINELKDFISDSIEKYGDIRISSVNINFSLWDS